MFHQPQLLSHPADSHVAQICRKLGVVGPSMVTAWGAGNRWKYDDGA